jgi:hypothetical protein
MVPVLLALALSGPISAQNSLSFSVLTHADRPFTCGDINNSSPREPEVVKHWIRGFWSGLNSAERSSGGGFVGSKLNAAGVYEEVKLYCQSHPSQLLEQATFAVRLKAKSSGM